MIPEQLNAAATLWDLLSGRRAYKNRKDSNMKKASMKAQLTYYHIDCAIKGYVVEGEIIDVGLCEGHNAIIHSDEGLYPFVVTHVESGLQIGKGKTALRAKNAARKAIKNMSMDTLNERLLYAEAKAKEYRAELWRLAYEKANPVLICETCRLDRDRCVGEVDMTNHCLDFKAISDP